MVEDPCARNLVAHRLKEFEHVGAPILNGFFVGFPHALVNRGSVSISLVEVGLQKSRKNARVARVGECHTVCR